MDAIDAAEIKIRDAAAKRDAMLRAGTPEEIASATAKLDAAIEVKRQAEKVLLKVRQAIDTLRSDYDHQREYEENSLCYNKSEEEAIIRRSKCLYDKLAKDGAIDQHQIWD